MNKLEFKISRKKEDGTNYQVTQIFIDGQDLIEILKNYELPIAEKEGSPDIAGSYEGLSPDSLFENLTDYPENHNSRDNKSNIPDCECGVSGCWSFMTKVEKKRIALPGLNLNNSIARRTATVIGTTQSLGRLNSTILSMK